VSCYFGLLFVHGSEARGHIPGTTMMNGDPADLAAELGNLRRGYQELLTRLNEIERGHTQRLDELSRAYIKIQGDPRRGHHKEISESKAVMGLKVLSDDRAHYKEWHTKFVNVFSQVRPGIRDVLREIEKHKDEAWTEQDFDIAMHDDRYRDKYEEWCQDMWWVLVEKTTGEALLRVRTVENGNGMEAYRRLHNWYGKQTDMGLAELRQRVIRPVQAKREEDIANCIEEWQESMMELRRVDPDYKELPDAYQIAALRGMLTGKYKDHIDMKLAVRDYDKDELLAEVRRYAALKRREMKNSNAMEVDAVNRGKGNSSTSISQRWPWIQACSQEGEDEEWGHWEEHWEDKEQGQVEEVQKGKGKGRPFSGSCYHCGKWGHSARNCPAQGKGFKGKCYSCGVQGHSAKYCPKGNTKGKSKGKGKTAAKWEWGKGKGGAREVNYEEEWEEEDEEGEDIGGIWQVVKGRRSSRKPTGQESTENKVKRTYKSRWDELEEGEEGNEGDIMHLGKDQFEWEEVKITIDSGAVDTVGPKK